MEDVRKTLVKISGSNYKENISLSLHTSFKTGGKAQYLVSPTTLREVKDILLLCKQYHLPFLILGKGTNTLISDRGFKGVVLLTENLDKIFIRGNRLLCEAGVKISFLLKTCLLQSLSGIEFLAGIPGTIGGAVISNAGLKDTWISDAIEEIYVFSPVTFEIKNLKKHDIYFAYRKSGLDDFFIYRVVLSLQRQEKESIRKNIQYYMKKRIASQPIGRLCAGSVFKNPPGFFAGELIEKTGFKGYYSGGACISSKHANFIINTGKASSQDIFNIISAVQKKIKMLYNIELEPEIKIVGDFEVPK